MSLRDFTEDFSVCFKKVLKIINCLRENGERTAFH